MTPPVAKRGKPATTKGNGPQNSKPSTSAQGVTEKDKKMLNARGRSTACGWFMRGGQHADDHACNPANLLTRINGIRSDIGAKKDPYHKVKFAADQ